MRFLFRLVLVLMFFLPGLLALWSGVRGSEWFFNSPGTRLWTRIFGARGARCFYILLGLLLIAAGILFWLDPLSKIG